jgi:hypothetical protein
MVGPISIEELFSIAIDLQHSYHSDPQIASSLLSMVTVILQSIDATEQANLDLAIAYMYFESAGNSSTSSRAHYAENSL